LPPLQWSNGRSVTVACGGATLDLYTAEGPVKLASGSALQLVGCDVRLFADGAAAAAAGGDDAAGGVAHSVFPGAAGSRVVLRDSMVSFPGEVRLRAILLPYSGVPDAMS
jgi:hypothetical protein